MANYERLDSVTNFFSGTQAEWEARTEIIPENMVIFTMDTHIMRIGDGTKTFAQLDDWIKFDEMPDQSGGNVPNILGTQPVANDAGKIVILGSDLSFVVSATALQDVLAAIQTAIGTNATQATAIGDLQTKADLIDLFDETNEGKLCVIANRKYAASDYTLDELNAEISNKVEKLLGLYVNNIKFYSDAGLTNEVNSFEGDSVYYAQIEAVDENNNPITYSLSSNNPKAVITTPTTNATGTFEITTGSITITEEVTFTASCDNGANNPKTLDKTININLPFILKMATYGNEDDDSYIDNYNIAIDNDGNYITTVERDMDFLIVKYDPDLNILAKKAVIIDGDYGMPNSTLIDNSNNIIICGEGYSDNLDLDIGFIVKISNDLSTIINSIGFNNTDTTTIDDIIFDQNDDIVACGGDWDVNNTLISRMDQDFNTSLIKQFENADTNFPLSDLLNIKMNPNNNEFYINAANDFGALIHFNNDFSNVINAYKYTNGTNTINFKKLIIDSLNNKLIIVGISQNEPSSGTSSGLLLILNLNDLSIINKKVYYGVDSDIIFSDLKINNDGNYIIIGNIMANSGVKGIITKINSSTLDIITPSKSYGDNPGYTGFYNIINDIDDNIIFGDTESDSISQNNDNYQMICNIRSLPTGSKTGTNTSLIFDDITLTAADSIIIAEAITVNEVTNNAVTMPVLFTLSNVDDTYKSDTIYP